MSGRHPISKLTQGWTAQRKAAVAADTARLLHDMQLQELRQALGVSQAELAERLNVKQPAISRLERRDDMTIGHLREVVRALGGELQITARFPQGDVTLNNFHTETGS